MDPLTLILVIVLVIFFFPLIMQGIGCLIKSIALIIVVVVAASLIMQLL
ncbi:hypothetical protein [Alkalicoccus chagannorensis]|nr:hypothetical protein [Alkalicoccus chagannorensis]